MNYTNIEEQGDGWVVTHAAVGVVIGVYASWEEAWVVARAIDAQMGAE